MKKFKHGMVLGKFFPPHNGHLYLIEEAFKQCETVDVFVCSLKSEFPSGVIRSLWMHEIYKDNYDISIIPVNDELPQTPDEYGDFDGFYKIWTDVVNSRTKNLDVIFTSESYGDEFAEKLGIEHVLVDIERLTYPVSGTSVRNEPVENWEYIPQAVRGYFKKRVVVLGPESTGKTTLVSNLSKHFDGDVVHEFGRDYTDDIPGPQLVASDFDEIAIAHDMFVDQVTNQTGTKPMVFIDTDAITTKLFGEMYLGDDFHSKIIDDIIDDQDFDLALVCNIDVPWVDDGTRDFPLEGDRQRHLDKIIKELESNGQPYKMIYGDYDKRLAMAIRYVEEISKK